MTVETNGLSEFVVGYGQPPAEETPASTAVSVGEGDTRDCFVHVAGTPAGAAIWWLLVFPPAGVGVAWAASRRGPRAPGNPSPSGPPPSPQATPTGFPVT